jgi:DNA-binding transcriptional MerR regulator
MSVSQHPSYCEYQAPAASGTLTIGQLARVVGISAKAIRYYEEMGLLPRAARAGNRYRRYGQADVNRLTLLRRIRLLGVPLSAARSLLNSTDEARCAEVQRELLRLVDERLAALDHEIAELRVLQREVHRYQRALAACHPDEAESFRDCQDMRCAGLGNTTASAARPADLESLDIAVDLDENQPVGCEENKHEAVCCCL